MPWWQDGVIYEIYPRSYADSNGDGVGDLRGIVERLDHLAWLGIDGIWLCPVTVSPDTDWGYDVADYCRVQPVFGTLEDFDVLVAEAGRRGMRVLLDLVPNHTSSKHPWFRQARIRTAPRRDFYVWADPKPDGSPPNNWLSSFGGPAWTMDPVSRQYYLHNFLPSQPDLNWWNEEVREAFDEILRFWFDRGVAGFRRPSRATTPTWWLTASARSTTPSGRRRTRCSAAGGPSPRATTLPGCCWARPT
jgi:alpha-glucosidase